MPENPGKTHLVKYNYTREHYQDVEDYVPCHVVMSRCHVKKQWRLSSTQTQPHNSNHGKTGSNTAYDKPNNTKVTTYNDKAHDKPVSTYDSHYSLRVMEAIITNQAQVMRIFPGVQSM